jgi:valyl-tRNA synthetase
LITDAKEYIAILDKKLLNENFVRNAPTSLVREEMDKKEQAKQKLEKLVDKLTHLV